MKKSRFKEIVKEVLVEDNEYQVFFQKCLDKAGKSIPEMGTQEKRDFFNKIDSAWKGRGEKKNEDLVGNQHKLDVDGDGEIEASDLKKLRSETITPLKKDKFYHDTRKNKTLRIFSVDGTKVKVEYFDPKTRKATGKTDTYTKNEVEYWIDNGAWNEYKQPFLKESKHPLNEGKFKKDDLVYNTRTKTVGIVRLGDDKYGEVKTDADGNVDVDELEKYNPIKNKHQQNAKVAPSTEKEVSKRGLFNPFSLNEDAKKVWKYKGVLLVDSDFVNFCKGKLPNSELKHAGMGDFFLQTPDGMISFDRTNGRLDGMGGRAHQMSDNQGGKLIALLIKKMGAKIVTESINSNEMYVGYAYDNNNKQIDTMQRIKSYDDDIIGLFKKKHERNGHKVVIDLINTKTKKPIRQIYKTKNTNESLNEKGTYVTPHGLVYKYYDDSNMKGKWEKLLNDPYYKSMDSTDKKTVARIWQNKIREDFY